MSKPLVTRTPDGGVSWDYSDVPAIARRLLEYEEQLLKSVAMPLRTLFDMRKAIETAIRNPQCTCGVLGSIKIMLDDYLPDVKLSR